MGDSLSLHGLGHPGMEDVQVTTTEQMKMTVNVSRRLRERGVAGEGGCLLGEVVCIFRDPLDTACVTVLSVGTCVAL